MGTEEFANFLTLDDDGTNTDQGRRALVGD
jgi:hypothetical protein